jgi:hypothetical protein
LQRQYQDGERRQVLTGIVLQHVTKERNVQTRLSAGSGDLSRTPRKALDSPGADEDLSGATGYEPEEPSIGQPAQEGAVPYPAVRQKGGQSRRVGAAADAGNGTGHLE